jgi:hypothetical protein
MLIREVLRGQIATIYYDLPLTTSLLYYNVTFCVTPKRHVPIKCQVATPGLNGPIKRGTLQLVVTKLAQVVSIAMLKL